MKLFSGRPSRRAAFTLIEVLTVITIILVLAGLLINIAGSASYNTAKSRATSEVKAMETALENYKTDNGSYPPDPFAPTDPTQSVPSSLLNPQTDFDPTSQKYLQNSEYLYQVLSGFPVSVGGATASTTKPPKYLDFSVQQLRMAADATSTVVSPGDPGMYIVDPFGFSYGYSTIYAANVAHNNATGSASTTTTVGYNPTFDLWSTAGYAPGGKSTPSGLTGNSTAAKYSSIWVKNW